MISVCLLISLYTSWITLSCLCKTGRKRKNRLSHGILKCKKNCITAVFGHVMIIFVLSVKQLNTISHFKSLYLDENVSRIFFYIFFILDQNLKKKNKQKKLIQCYLFFLFFAILPKAQGVNKVQTSSFNWQNYWL